MIAEAFGLRRISSVDTLMASSKLGPLVRVGDVAGDEPWEVIKVLWPDDMYENLLLSLRLSSWCPSKDVMLLVIDRWPVDDSMDGGCIIAEAASSSLC